MPGSCVHRVPSRDERLPLSEGKWRRKLLQGSLFFFSPVRSPLGKAYVSSRVDTDTLLPCHLVARLTRGEKKETLKGNARGVVSLLSGA